MPCDIMLTKHIAFGQIYHLPNNLRFRRRDSKTVLTSFILSTLLHTALMALETEKFRQADEMFKKTKGCSVASSTVQGLIKDPSSDLHPLNDHS